MGERGRFVVGSVGQDGAGARLVDADQPLHQRRGQRDFPTDQWSVAVGKVMFVQPVLYRVGFVDAAWAQGLGQAGEVSPGPAFFLHSARGPIDAIVVSHVRPQLFASSRRPKPVRPRR